VIDGVRMCHGLHLYKRMDGKDSNDEIMRRENLDSSTPLDPSQSLDFLALTSRRTFHVYSTDACLDSMKQSHPLSRKVVGISTG